jgi:4-carboxymuconolactone decarboxylase
MTQDQHAAESRLQRGTRALSEIDGKAGENVVASLADIAPDFARYILEFPFGDIYSRPGLNLRDREIATVAALTAMGTATPQLKVHIEAGLNVGHADGRLCRFSRCAQRPFRGEGGFRAARSGAFVRRIVAT